MDEKIIPFNKLSAYIKSIRARRKTPVIVLCHGCFDIVHPGHIRHLRFAKEQGGMLVVSITPDVCIQKGSSRPFMPQDLRAENLAALEIIDAVTIAPAETGVEIIEALEPDIYVKGNEYALSKDPRFLKEKELVEKLGGRVAYSSGDVVFSSSELIRDHQVDAAENVKLVYLCNRYEVKRKKLDEIFNSAREKKFLIVGEAILDEYKYCEGLGIAQETPVLSISLKNKTQFVGGSGSLAMHLASIGADVTFLTSVDIDSHDCDVYGRKIADSGISFINIQDCNRPLAIKSHYFVNNNQVLEMENGPYKPLYSNFRTRIIKHYIKEIKNSPDCVILSDFGYGLLSEDLVIEMTEIAASKKVLLASDISMTLRTKLEKFYDSDIVTATEMELRSCFHDYESGFSVLVDRLYSESRVKEFYLTLADGSALFFKRPSKSGHYNMESAHIPSLLLQKADNLGRGEAFLAGVALGKVSGANSVQSMYLGSLFGAIHSRKIGNEPVRQEDIFRLMDERKELLS